MPLLTLLMLNSLVLNLVALLLSLLCREPGVLAYFDTMANYRVTPPVFGGSKSYKLYKIQLEAWEIITDLPEEKQGLSVAINLPDNDPSKIKERVFESMGLDKLKEKSGLKELKSFMDKHLQKDGLEDAWNKFKDFEDYQKSPNESITSFISSFDQKYERVKIKGMTLPANLLAFKLLKSANLSQEERLLVMTGIDITKADDMYVDAKRSLSKFMGHAVGGPGDSMPSLSIKEEPVFYTGTNFRRANSSYTRGNFRPGGRGSFPSSSRGSMYQSGSRGGSAQFVGRSGALG